MSILRVIAMLKNKGYKPGRLQRTYKNITTAGISKAVSPLTAKRAAWLIYLYGCAPQMRNTARYWILKHVQYFKEITETGDETPVEYIAKFLEHPDLLQNIVAIGIDRKTEAVMSLDKDNNFHMPTRLSINAMHARDKPDIVFFSREILQEIAIMVNESTEHHKQELLN